MAFLYCVFIDYYLVISLKKVSNLKKKTALSVASDLANPEYQDIRKLA